MEACGGGGSENYENYVVVVWCCGVVRCEQSSNAAVLRTWYLGTWYHYCILGYGAHLA